MNTHPSAIAGVLVAWLAIVPTAIAAEVSVIASNAVRDALSELVPVFERESGHKVTVVWGGTIDIARRVASGEVFDLVIIPASWIDDLIEQRRLRVEGRRDFVRSAIGVATRLGVAMPDISSGGAIKESLLAARSIVLSSGPSAFYLVELFERMGITDAIRPKVKQLPPGRSVGEALANGDGDIGFTQVSEFITVKGIVYLGPLSDDVQHMTVFSMGVHIAAATPEAAHSLGRFLTSPAAVPAIRHSGMEPVLDAPSK